MQQYEHRILVSPKDTTLVVIDHQTAFASCFDDDAIERAEEGVAALIRAASALDVPVIASFVVTNRIDASVSSQLEKSIRSISHHSRTGANPWDDASFEEAVREANRPRLLIAGLSAETSLSFTALCALERGFDVYLVKDTSLGHSPESFATTFDRLTQAGAVPVSWRQVMIEWRQNDADVGLLRRVLKSRRSATGR